MRKPSKPAYKTWVMEVCWTKMPVWSEAIIALLHGPITSCLCLCCAPTLWSQQILPLCCHRQWWWGGENLKWDPLSTPPPLTGSWFPGKELKSQSKWEGKQVLFRLRERGQNRIPGDRMRVSPEQSAPMLPWLCIPVWASVKEGTC